MQYTVDTPINKFRSDVTPQMLLAGISKIKPGSPLAALVNAFYTAGQKYNVDQVYLVAHAALESAWGTSVFARERNNLYGYQAYDSNPDAAGYFTSKENCIDFIARFVSQSYLSPNGKWYGGSPTLKGMNVRYATAKHWSSSIASICNQLESAFASAPTSSLASYKVLPLHRNVTIVSRLGVNVRVSPTTLERNIVKVFNPGTNFAVEGFVEGEVVENNKLWWKLKDENAFVWSGTTNIIPTIPAVAPVVDPTPDTTKSKEELLEELRLVREEKTALVSEVTTLKKVNEEYDRQLTQLRVDIAALQEIKKKIELVESVNKGLALDIETYKVKLGELKRQRDLAYTEAFTGWELIEIPKGVGALVKLPVLALKIQALIKDALNNDFVIGWKKGAKIYKAPEVLPTPAETVDTL